MSLSEDHAVESLFLSLNDVKILKVVIVFARSLGKYGAVQFAKITRNAGQFRENEKNCKENNTHPELK